MALTVTNKPFVTDIAEDTYPAVCIGIFDIGTVDNPRFNKQQDKVVFLFEVPDLVDAEGWPRTINEEWAASLDDRSHLLRHLRSWMGRSLAPEEKKNFSLKSLLGQPCQLEIVHGRGKGEKSDNVYANIGGVRKPARGQVGPEPRRQPLYFDFADGHSRIPEGTPEYIAKKIAAAPQWKNIQAGRAAEDYGDGKKGIVAPPSGPPKNGQQAPAEIVDVLNEIGLAYPYDQDELDSKFPADMSQDVYAILSKHATPF